MNCPGFLAVSVCAGFVSSVFDNIPLTKLALDQSNYDWGMLAYAVGFGVPSPGLGHRPEWPSRTLPRRAIWENG